MNGDIFPYIVALGTAGVGLGLALAWLNKRVDLEEEDAEDN